MRLQLKIRLLLKELFFFCVTYALGIGVAFRVLQISEQVEQIPEPLPLWAFFVYFFVVTILVLISFRFAKGGLPFRIFLGFAIFSGSLVVFSALVSELFAVYLAVLVLLLYFQIKRVWIHNLAMVLAVAGIGGAFGLSITPPSAVIILLVLSVYDFIAVYKTKHMVKMAKAMIKRRAIFALIIPEDLSGLRASLKEVKQEKLPKILPSEEASQPKIGRFLILGGGDLALPLLLVASLVAQGILKAIIVSIFVLGGVFLGHLLFVFKKGRPMPALPPIALFAILGFLVTLLL